MQFCTRSKCLRFSIISIIIIYCCEDTTPVQQILDYGIVINEINYNSSDNFDSDDWVEIYNNSNDTIDIGSWLLKDEDDEHIFTVPSSLAGLPALSLPGGLSKNNRPLGLQLIANTFREDLLFTGAYALEQEINFKDEAL